MNRKVVIAGHICIDITPTFPKQGKVDITEFLKPGKLLNVGEANIHTGGAVANTGLAMKLLGADVTLAGKIGDDAFGDMVTSIMEKHGAADGLIRRTGESTSYSVVLAVPGIDRIFLHHPGANDTFTADDLSDELLSDCMLFHFGYPPLMRRLYENDGNELIRVFERAKTAGAVTSLDLAAVDTESDAGRADWEKILTKTLPYVDIFAPSIEELMFMLDRPRYEEITRKAVQQDFCEMLDIEQDVRPLAEKCVTFGAKLLLIKCGAPGMYFYSAPGKALEPLRERLGLDPGLWESKAVFEKSYVPEKILSGTGAGDTSIAAFLSAILSGESPEMCLHLAAAEGASCVAAYDALGGLKSLPELKQKIEAGWKKTE